MEEFHADSDDDFFIPAHRAAKRPKGEKAVKETCSGSAGAHNRGSSGSWPESAAAAGVVAVAYVPAGDSDALDCGVCYFPLKPPIFQCDEGHVVCSSCRDKLAPAGKCHVCRIATRSYHRCRAMERLVESIRVPCPNAAHGCDARPAYYDKHGHGRVCQHAPRGCPGKDCGFLGSTKELLDHFTGTHRWPCTINIRVGETCKVCLHEGFNFLLADLANDDSQGATASRQFLFLLNVTRLPIGRAISVHFIGQKPSSERLTCALRYSRRLYAPHDGHKLGTHSMQSEINVECTDLSNGLPDPDDCFQFIVPNFILGDDDKEGAIRVKSLIAVVDLK